MATQEENLKKMASFFVPLASKRWVSILKSSCPIKTIKTIIIRVDLIFAKRPIQYHHQHHHHHHHHLSSPSSSSTSPPSSPPIIITTIRVDLIFAERLKYLQYVCSHASVHQHQLNIFINKDISSHLTIPCIRKWLQLMYAASDET